MKVAFSEIPPARLNGVALLLCAMLAVRQTSQIQFVKFST